MKKILFFLAALFTVGSLLLAGCSSPSDPNGEREVQGRIVAISTTFDFNGINVAVLVWQSALSQGDSKLLATDQWVFYPPSEISSELERKEVKIRYKLTAQATLEGSTTHPLVQILSVEEVTKKKR